MLKKKITRRILGLGVITTLLLITPLTANATTDTDLNISIEKMQEVEEFCKIYNVEMSNDPDFINEVQSMLEERSGNNFANGGTRYSFEDRKRVAKWGIDQVGKGYDANFSDNKKNTVANNKRMNCSELVWKAWKFKKNVDLDSNGGPGVYPNNIKNSNRTKLIQ